MGRIALAMALVLGGLFLSGCLNPRAGEPLRAVITTVPDPPRGDPALTVRFSAAESTGVIDEYLWDFGDGGSARGRIVEHTYYRPGNYRVVLHVVGPSGERTAEVKVHVNSARPVIERFQTAMTNIFHLDSFIEFYVSAYDPDGEVRFIHWDFGNGVRLVTGYQTRGFAASDIYSKEGDYEVTIQVEDANGDLSLPASLRITILPPCGCG